MFIDCNFNHLISNIFNKIFRTSLKTVCFVSFVIIFLPISAYSQEWNSQIKYEYSSLTQPIPKNIIKKFQLKTNIYKKYLQIADGLYIFTPADVSDKDLHANARMISDMLKGHTNVKKKMVKDFNLRILLVNKDMRLPELHDGTVRNALEKGMNYIGGYSDAGGEYKGTGNIMTSYVNPKKVRVNPKVHVTIHEIAHAMDHALRDLYPNYDSELTKLFNDAFNNSAVPNSRWSKHNPNNPESFNNWPMDNKFEFIAKLVSTLYNADRDIAKTPYEFKAIFPSEYAFVKKYYGEKPNLRVTPF